jgi:hypothetical protein
MHNLNEEDAVPSPPFEYITLEVEKKRIACGTISNEEMLHPQSIDLQRHMQQMAVLSLYEKGYLVIKFERESDIHLGPAGGQIIWATVAKKPIQTEGEVP